MANCLDALQSSRRSQCSSTSVRTTWLYRPDAIQGLTSIRVSASRPSYGKMASTFRTMCDPVRTSPFRVWTLQGLIMVITCSQSATVRTLGQHRPDARATPSGRGLVMGAINTILERRLQLTVLTLGQAVRTPSGILIITFYSNIELGQNWRH